MMKCIVVVLSGALALGAVLTSPAPAAAQDEGAAAPEPEKKRSPYYRKVKGWLWLEGVAGPSSYDADQFNGLSFATTNAAKSRGPQFGFNLGTGFGGGFFLGWYYRQGNYDGYKLARTGVEFQPTIRIPFVHIMFRIDFGYAKMFGGNPWGIDGFDNGGVDATFGLGLRIPIVRWISIAAALDWSYIGLNVRGNDPTTGERRSEWASGQVLTGTFALTFHFIGVRKD